MSHFLSSSPRKNKKRGWQLFILVCLLQLLTMLIGVVLQH